MFFMALPFFYIEEIQTGSGQLVLNEETSKHVVQVLRMQPGEHLNLTDGTGNLFAAEIIDDHKKKCRIKILSTVYRQPSERKITIAISLIKNASRFEWFLEKATEIGINEIIPLICERTEKQHVRFERMKGILVSAMLQSQQTWLPVIAEPIKYSKFIVNEYMGQNFIAHCEDEQIKKPLHQQISTSAHQLICIGPEGDFSPAEIEQALQQQFIPVSLG